MKSLIVCFLLFSVSSCLFLDSSTRIEENEENNGTVNNGVDNNGVDNNGVDNNGVDNNGVDNNGVDIGVETFACELIGKSCVINGTLQETCPDGCSVGKPACEEGVYTGCTVPGFVDLSAGGNLCALRSDETVLCNIATPTSSKFSKISVGITRSCGLIDKKIVCWDHENGGTTATSVDASEISVGEDDSVCGLMGGRLKCFDAENQMITVSNEIRTIDLVSLSVPNATFGCGLDDQNKVVCWERGGDQLGKLGNAELGDTKAEKVIAFEFGQSRNICVITKGEKKIDCLVKSDSLGNFPNNLPGNMVDLAGGSDGICWLHNGGAPGCLGRDLRSGIPSDDGFSNIVVGNEFACALSAENKIECWGKTPPSLENF